MECSVHTVYSPTWLGSGITMFANHQEVDGPLTHLSLSLHFSKDGSQSKLLAP